jgi:hypothetical protein
MAIDIKKLAKKRDEVASSTGGGGDFWNVDEGEYLVYLHGQNYPDDDHELTGPYNFIETVFHYGVGGKKGGQVCLNSVINPVLNHPKVKEFLAARKTPIDLGKKSKCPVCEAIADGDVPDDQAERMKAQTKWLFGTTPMFYRKTKGNEWSKLKFEPMVLIAGVTVFNDITGEMIDLSPRDLSDPKKAILLQLSRKGKDFNNTKYKVKAERDDTKLDKGQRKIILKAIAPDGPCDLFKVLANLTKTYDALNAQLTGVDVDVEDGEEDDDPSCFGTGFEEDDEDCDECEVREDCRKKVEGGEDEEEEEEDEEDEGEDDGEEEEDEGDDEDNDSEEEEGDEGEEGDDEEEEGDEDGEEEDDEDLAKIDEEINNAIKGKAKKKKTEKGKAKKEKAEKGKAKKGTTKKKKKGK